MPHLRGPKRAPLRMTEDISCAGCKSRQLICSYGMAEELAEKRMFIKIVQKITNAMAVIKRISILLRYRSLCGYMIMILLSVRPDSRLKGLLRVGPAQHHQQESACTRF